MSQTAACRERRRSANGSAVWSLAAALLLAAVSPPLHACDGGTAVPDPGNNAGMVGDCRVLLALHDELVGVGSLNWGTQLAMSSWQGIGVSGSPSRVTTLDLGYNQLTGTIPVQLGQLNQLGVLDLNDNQLTGPIPVELGQLNQLTQLDLHNNQLTGEIPAELGQLSQLGVLYLGRNQLTGEIPAELAQLTQLERLELHNNQLTGEIPAELGQLSQLGVLYLGRNQLTGEIPAELAQLTQLERLELHNNQLTGEIPAELGQLKQLTRLDLAYNQLTGTITAELGDLTSLQTLYLPANELSGEIPAQLGQLSQLERLDLGGNQLTGPIPAELGQLKQLEELDLGPNRLTGTIPAQLGQLTQLTRLDLGPNRLTGAIPTWLSQLTQLERLELDGNQLTGAIPTWLSQLNQLTRLYLYNNQLTGPIPAQLAQLTQLEQLVLHDNQLTGPIPAWLSQLNQLTRLYLGYNQLTGPIPAWLSQLNQLEGLTLSGNQLTGPIPVELAQLSNLEYLGLADNQLTGPIPTQLAQLIRLTRLYLYNNQLTGTIPAWLSQLNQLERLYLNGNQLTGTIPVQLSQLSQLERLHLADNQLTGTIPVQLDQLFRLQWLYLDHNHLTGEIPIDLGQLPELRRLHLQHNQLTGTIPIELGRLSDLEQFSFRGNRLTGSVPTPLNHLPDVYVLNLAASMVGPGRMKVTWDDSGDPTTRYEYRFSDRVQALRGWTGIENPETTLRVGEGVTIEWMLTGLPTDVFVSLIEVRASNGKGFSPAAIARVRPAQTAQPRLDFAHFANGAGITSDLVLVNVATHPIRPTVYFYDKEGNLIGPESVVDVTGDLMVIEDGSLTVQTEIEPLGELTLSTHGRENLVTGSVTVDANGPIGGVLRFDLPGIGVAGLGASQPVQDAIFPARRQAGGISAAAAIHNPGEEAMVVNCQLMKAGSVLEEAEISLAANGQEAQFIEQMFTSTDTSDFVGSVRCTAPGLFTGVAVELDDGNRIFTTLPVVPVDQTGGSNKETALDFAHFANGASITSSLVLVNVATHPIRPALYFYDQEGEPIAAESVVDVTGDLEVQEDGALSSQTAMEPLGELTISTHGRGDLVSGSVKVVSEGPIGGVLRFDLPGIGVAGVGASLPLTDAIFPARRQAGGISTAAAIHNSGEEAMVVNCQLMKAGSVLEEMEILLAANGHEAQFIEQMFTNADTFDFVGSVRCTGETMFTGVAVELDEDSRILTTLPVIPVQR